MQHAVYESICSPDSSEKGLKTDYFNRVIDYAFIHGDSIIFYCMCEISVEVNLGNDTMKYYIGNININHECQ